MYKHLADSVQIFNKGEIILRQGEITKYIYYLESGTCYRTHLTDKGDNIIYEIKEPDNTVNSLLGSLTTYTHSGKSFYTFTARTTCHCHRISVAVFKKWVLENPLVLQELLELSMDQYGELRQAFQSYQEGRIANRLCQILLSCCKTIHGEPVIIKKYTFGEMASMLGVHQVTVSRIVRSLCNEGVLDRSPQGFHVLDYEKLQNYANKEEQLLYK